MKNKKVTIYDIAEVTGVSIATVNRALNNKTRISPATKELVLKTAKKLGYKANPAAQALRRSLINIGAILFCPVDEYVDSIIDGMRSSAADLEKYHVMVDIQKVKYGSIEECLAKTATLIDCFAGKGYNGIILFLSASFKELTKIRDIIDNYSKKNIFFATVANDIPNSNRVLHVGINAFTAGKMAAEILEMTCYNQDVAILTGQVATVTSEYVSGFTEFGRDKFSNIKIYEHHDKEEKIHEIVLQLLQENPNLCGVYMPTANSIKACEYIRSNSQKKLSIITTDLLNDTPRLLKKKDVSAAIFQNPYRQGKNVVRFLYNYIVNKNDAGTHFIIPQILISSNCDEYLSNENL